MPKNEEIIIRPANLADAKAIEVILRELGWFAHLNGETPSVTEERISRHLELCSVGESHLVLVAENQIGEVIGYIAVHWLPYLILAGPEGYVSELFIRESERGKGIGRKLLILFCHYTGRRWDMQRHFETNCRKPVEHSFLRIILRSSLSLVF